MIQLNFYTGSEYEYVTGYNGLELNKVIKNSAVRKYGLNLLKAKQTDIIAMQQLNE